MNALDVLLAGLPFGGDAGGTAELLARLAVTRTPQQVSLSLCAGGGVVRLLVRTAEPSRSFAESAPGAYARDLAEIDGLTQRWGHAARSTGQTLWWAQLGDAPRIGGAR